MSLTFAGYPVELRKVPGDVLVHCKNVIGCYTQARTWKKRLNGATNIYPWGVKTTEPAYIKQSPFAGKVEIACLEGTQKEFDAIYDECKKILNIN